MELFTVSFAELTVSIKYESSEAGTFLSFLFEDISKPSAQTAKQHQLSLLKDTDQAGYLLSDGDMLLYHGPLDVQFAAHLYDTVIFHLLNKASDGIALHAGGIICGDKTVLLPGQSGAGKSTLTAWLVSQGCSYLTDELIFISINDSKTIQYFNRPVCLKPGSVRQIEPLLTDHLKEDILKDQYGAIIPHRFLNPRFRPAHSPPSLILLPSYQPSSNPELETISPARLGTLLMGCHVNARNLVDHGFKQILDIARSTPAYRLRYTSFQDAENFLNKILHDPKRVE